MTHRPIARRLLLVLIAASCGAAFQCLWNTTPPPDHRLNVQWFPPLPIFSAHAMGLQYGKMRQEPPINSVR